MTTRHPEFNDTTEGLEVAKAFADSVKYKTVLVTGVNPGGIGFTTAEAFASQSPAHLIVTGRTEAKLKESIDKLRSRYPSVDYRLLTLDLSSQKSVRAAAAELNSWTDVPTLDIIVNSAGIMCLPERTLSEDGIEMHFATNHIGHFLLVNLLMPKLIKAAEQNPVKGATRILNVSSLSPKWAGIRWSDINFDKKNKDLPATERPNYDVQKAWGESGDLGEKSYLPLEGYNQSKVANVLFSIGLNSRLYEKYGILSLAVHPGVIRTELGRSFKPETLDAISSFNTKYRTVGAGASTSVVAALDPKLDVGNGPYNDGVFLADCQIVKLQNSRAVSNEEAARLWEVSEELVMEKFNW